jgi:hypothetical protein
MVITLFDPGEGGNTIRILDPAGNAVNFDYFTDPAGYSGTNTSTLSVSGTGTHPYGHRSSNSKFNDRKVTLMTTLPATFPASWGTAGYWWKIRYNFTSGAVTDRTTWGVTVTGQPVHLLNE